MIIGPRTTAALVLMAVVATTAFAAGVGHQLARLPSILHGPSGTTLARAATFQFAANGRSDRRFQCRLDGGRWHDCGVAPRGRRTYRNLSHGRHRFCVRVQPGSARRAATPTPRRCRSWQVTTLQLAGSTAMRLTPGGADVPVLVQLTNPSQEPAIVTRVWVAVAATTQPACSPRDFEPTQAWSGRLQVPPRTTISLQGAGIPPSSWPRLRMVETGRNQDPCKGQQLRLSVHAAGAPR